MIIVNTLVEGLLDEAVAQRLLESVHLIPGAAYGRRGADYIHRKIAGFNSAAAGSSYLAMVDLMDTKLPCPPAVLSAWLPTPHPRFHFCVVVREIESWLLADRGGLAQFLAVSTARMPHDPEAVPDPKQTLVNLARRSRSSRTREAIVPKQGSTAQVGPLYVDTLSRFVRSHWNIDSAKCVAPSLERCVSRLSSLSASGSGS